MKIGGILETNDLTLYCFTDLKDQPGAAASVLKFFGEKKLNLEYITESTAADDTAVMTVCVKSKIVKKIESFLRKNEDISKHLNISKTDNVSVIGIYGPHFREKPSIAARFCITIGEVGINILSLSSSISSICGVIKSSKVKLAKKVLLKRFKLP
jgi:aspartokinase